jgi:hypothetical protein
MELSKLIPTAQSLEVLLPNGEPTGIILQVVGKESAQFFAASHRWTAHIQERGDKKMNLQELADMQADLLASLIVGWTGLEDNGSPLPYSHAQAVKLMQMPELQFLRNAVEDFASTRSNFFRASAGIAPAVRAAESAAGHA